MSPIVRTVLMQLTFHHPIGILTALLLGSACTQSTESSREQVLDSTVIAKDSESFQQLASPQYHKIGEPFLVSEIKDLEFTSTAGKPIEQHQRCNRSGTGFYGLYLLIDPQHRQTSLHPVGGSITVYTDQQMSTWRADDPNQVIWEIHLTSDVISVWDSVVVGMSRSEVEHFGESTVGNFTMEVENLYTCEYEDFSAEFLFDRDTLTEVTVTRKCEQG